MRESLTRTKDRLEQEKRLNSAIKQKKTYHLENENVTKGGWPRHACPPEDLHGDVCTNWLLKLCITNVRFLLRVTWKKMFNLFND